LNHQGVINFRNEEEKAVELYVGGGASSKGRGGSTITWSTALRTSVRTGRTQKQTGSETLGRVSFVAKAHRSRRQKEGPTNDAYRAVLLLLVAASVELEKHVEPHS